jgi:hypothetical protein
VLLLTAPVRADTVRIAAYHTDLGRDGPGLLLRDILRGDDQVAALVQVIAQVAPDVVLLLRVDYDHGAAALSALVERLAEAGAPYPHRFALRPNSGMATGMDIDGDGRLGTPDDAQGFGRFAGAGGMAILSRLPLDQAAARDFSGFLWRDLPGALLPDAPVEALAIQRLSSVGHWDVPVILPDGTRLHLLAFHGSTPAFGRGDRNLRRNHDEVRFWQRYLDGALPMSAPDGPLVLFGSANLDPQAGDGIGQAMADLLAHPRLQDPGQTSPGAAAAAASRREPAQATVDWDRPGRLRAVYVLPSSDLSVAGSGVYWPAPGDPMAQVAAAASRHRLVWVDLALP